MGRRRQAWISCTIGRKAERVDAEGYPHGRRDCLVEPDRQEE